jgi:hypothetical protein
MAIEESPRVPEAEWSPLTERERSLLEALLSQEFAGSRELLAQVAVAEAQSGCDCGCGTISLRVNEARAPAATVTGALAPGEAEVVSAEGDSVGGLIVFVHHGYLSCLEIYTWGEPAPLPSPERIRPYVIRGRAADTEP